HSPLGGRGMRMNDFHSQLTHGPLKLTLRLLPPFQLFFHAGGLARSIRGVFVQIDTARQPVALHPAPKTVQRRYRALMVVAISLDRFGGIVNVAHQNQLRASPFQPVVVRSIHLHHLTKAAPPRPPLPVWSGSALSVG